MITTTCDGITYYEESGELIGISVEAEV